MSSISCINISDPSIKSCINRAIPPLASIIGAGTGCCIVAGLLGIVNPLGGILFGATAAAITNGALPILESICNRDKNPAMSNLLGYLMIPLHCIGAAALSAALITTVGFPIGFSGAAMLGVASLVSMFVAGQLASVAVLNM